MKKRVLSVLLVSSLALGTITLPATAFADDVDQKIEQSNKKIEELNSQVAAAEEALASVRANIETVKEKAQKLQEEQQKLNGEITTLTGEIEDLTKKIEKRDDKIKEQARAAQTGGISGGYLEAVLSADSISDAITRVAAAGRLVSASNDLMKQQEQDKKAVETKRAESEEKVEKLNENAAELEAQKGVLVDQEYQQTILVSTIEAEKTTEEGKKSQYLAEKEAAEKARAEEARLAQEALQRSEEVAALQQADNEQQDSQTNGQSQGNQNSGQTTPNNNNGPSNSGGETTPPKQPETVKPVKPQGGGAGAVLAEAANHLGKPYVWGGKGPDVFDCSGFVSYVFANSVGISLPSYTVSMEGYGTPVPLSQVQAGDLLFWGSPGGSHHVAISTGGTGYIHAPTEGQNVSYGSFAYYAPSFAMRVL